jgi:hypothetical protein
MARCCFGCRCAAVGFVPLQLAILADSRSGCLSADSIASGLLPKKFITLWKWRLWPPFSMTMLLYTFKAPLSVVFLCLGCILGPVKSLSYRAA